MGIGIVGPGALGLFFGAKLAIAGEDVAFYHPDPARAEILRRGVTLIDGAGVQGRTKVQASADPEAISGATLVLFLVKSYDTTRAAVQIQGHLGPGATLLTLQNGLGSLEALGQICGPDRVRGGVTAQGATLLAPDTVFHAGSGLTLLTAPLPALDKAGLPTAIVADLEGARWDKLLVSVGINALTALAGIPNGAILGNIAGEAILREAVEEGEKVARALGVCISPDPAERTLEVAQRTATNRSSMLQDLDRGKGTEIEVINGQIVRFGQELHIPTPVNRLLCNLVRLRERSQ